VTKCVEDSLAVDSDSTLTSQNFTFSHQTVHCEPFECIRAALRCYAPTILSPWKVKKKNLKFVFGQPDGGKVVPLHKKRRKAAVSKSNKLVVKIEEGHAVEQKLKKRVKIVLRRRRSSQNGSSATTVGAIDRSSWQTSYDKEGNDPLVCGKNDVRKGGIKRKLKLEHNYSKGATENGNASKRPTLVTSSIIPVGTSTPINAPPRLPAAPCGMSCFGQCGPPTISCRVCMCMFHSACCGVPASVQSFTCKVSPGTIMLFHRYLLCCII